jgi:hypothetical protein
VGVIGAPENYQWLREEYEPSARVAYSWLVYEIPELLPRHVDTRGGDVSTSSPDRR